MKIIFSEVFVHVTAWGLAKRNQKSLCTFAPLRLCVRTISRGACVSESSGLAMVDEKLVEP
jgi:hypothetical protein